jgi:outer membrane biosynthesis protein TonB
VIDGERHDGDLSDASPPDRMTAGVILSSGAHLAAIAVILAAWYWTQAPPKRPHIVTITLVRLAAKTESPTAPIAAPVPQQAARRSAPTAPTSPTTPAAETHPPTAPHPTAKPARDATAKVLPPPPQPKPAPPRPRPLATRHPPQTPDRALATRLAFLARLHENDRGLAAVTAASGDAQARDASASIKDFIRAQVERRWNLDRRAARDHDWVVAIHIQLRPDGSVRRADIVDAARYRHDAAYFDFALSARDAVLVSSPLALPPGGYAIAKDMVLNFDARQVLR